MDESIKILRYWNLLMPCKARESRNEIAECYDESPGELLRFVQQFSVAYSRNIVCSYTDCNERRKFSSRKEFYDAREKEDFLCQKHIYKK
jgi:hypothetical protein